MSYRTNKFVKRHTFVAPKDAPDFTLFLLTYNHEDTIRETFEGILRQKTQYKFIVKILEDCSTDNTLAICKEYVEKYPDMFKLIAQPKNTRCAHIKPAMINEIKTQYWAFIEGDDYHIADNFFETAITFLKQNPEYNMFAGNFYCKGEKETILAHENMDGSGHDISINNYLYSQTSARVYRNILDFANMPNYPFDADIYLYWLYLDCGRSYFYHTPVSVYRTSMTGMWTRLTKPQKRLEMRKVTMMGYRFFGFKYANYFMDIYPKRTMKRLRRVFGTKITLFIAVIYEFIKREAWPK